ncbi:MAG: DUF4493 domain-containing protein [Rikenellaceae bacterium]|nr:DUF4493 domain-containing protein [Rikenellaceae bacterium]
MKHLWMIPMLAAALLGTACSAEDDLQTGAGEGNVSFSIEVPAEIAQIETRATSGYALPAELVPSVDAFALQLTGTYLDAQNLSHTYQNSWETVAAFHAEKPDLNAGTYSATFTYGEASVEGVGKPYFTGALTNFEVKANKTSTYPVTCKLANSCFTLQVSQWMLNYYKDIQLTIHTATNSFTYTLTSTQPTELVFVNPSQVLSISGSAVKSQTGVEVEFPKSSIGGSLAAETKYAVQVDHGSAGAGSLKITFDGTFTEVAEVEVELNPEV